MKTLLKGSPVGATCNQVADARAFVTLRAYWFVLPDRYSDAVVVYEAAEAVCRSL